MALTSEDVERFAQEYRELEAEGVRFLTKIADLDTSLRTRAGDADVRLAPVAVNRMCDPLSAAYGAASEALTGIGASHSAAWRVAKKAVSGTDQEAFVLSGGGRKTGGDDDEVGDDG